MLYGSVAKVFRKSLLTGLMVPTALGFLWKYNEAQALIPNTKPLLASILMLTYPYRTQADLILQFFL